MPCFMCSYPYTIFCINPGHVTAAISGAGPDPPAPQSRLGKRHRLTSLGGIYIILYIIIYIVQMRYIYTTMSCALLNIHKHIFSY